MLLLNGFQFEVDEVSWDCWRETDPLYPWDRSNPTRFTIVKKGITGSIQFTGSIPAELEFAEMLNFTLQHEESTINVYGARFTGFDWENRKATFIAAEISSCKLQS